MTQEQLLRRIMSNGRVVRFRDLATIADQPISRAILWKMKESGEVVAEAGGYRLADKSDITFDRHIEFMKRHPDGVLCLYTALRLASILDRDLDLTDEIETADTVALARHRNARTLPNCRVVRWSDPRMFTEGVIEKDIDGNIVRYTNPERSVADLFRPAHRITNEDAFKALRGLAIGMGEQAVIASFTYARTLGWGNHMNQAVHATKEMLRCVPLKP